ncbi:MAG: sugar phosphate nucleotidyltransferase [Caldilineaceae bacterium]
MQFFLMAAGNGGKLPPLTASLPSPMLPILNRPVMTYPVELLARHGASQILTALHDQSATIEQYFGDGRRWNVHLNYFTQRQPMGSAGALKHVEHSVTETLLVLPADTLMDLDIAAAIHFHQHHGGPATMIMQPCRPSHCDRQTGDQEILQWLQDKSALDQQMRQFTGAVILEPETLSLIPGGQPADIANDLLPALIGAGYAVHCFNNSGYWNDLSSFEAYQEAQVAMLASLRGEEPADGQVPLRYPFQEGHELRPGIWCGTHTVIHPTAKLVAPLYIGSDCRIGAQAEIGPHTVLGAHSVVDEGATVQESIVLHHTYIGRLVDIQQRIVAQNLLIDRSTGTALPVTDPFLLGKVTPRATHLFMRALGERLLAALLIGLFAPVFVIVALLIWATSGLAPFCTVERFGVKPMGLAQELPKPTMIRLLHFRTRQANQQVLFLGQWLEQWQLQRLPELLSVIGGELALVGVKPLTAEEQILIVEEWQMVRYQVAAGFTVLWYIHPNPEEHFDLICTADSYQAATDHWRKAVSYLRQTPVAWLRATRPSPEKHQLANTSEVRSQPVVQ